MKEHTLHFILICLLTICVYAGYMQATVYGQDNWRPFVHVKDLARAVVMVLKAKPENIQSQIFNVGDKNQNMTIMQVAEAVKEVVGQYREVEIKVQHDIDDKRNYLASFEKINLI